MSPLSVLAITVWLLAAVPQAGPVADWTSIKPQATTEAELTSMFGPPDEVEAVFPWSEWSATWKKRPVSSRYLVRYTKQASRSKLLEGPLGMADEVEVSIALKKVISVEWIHGGPSARPAAARVRGDTQLTHITHEGVVKSAKNVPDGFLSFEVAQDESRVRILLQMK